MDQIPLVVAVPVGIILWGSVIGYCTYKIRTYMKEEQK